MITKAGKWVLFNCHAKFVNSQDGKRGIAVYFHEATPNR